MPLRKKPKAPDLKALLRGLNEAGVEFVVVGGMAAVAQGAPVTTFDLDIVHRQTDEKEIEATRRQIQASDTGRNLAAAEAAAMKKGTLHPLESV